MRKLMIFFTASLAVSAMVMYMYNTAAAALTEDGASGREDLTEGETDKPAPAKSTTPKGNKGTLQQSAVQRGGDPDMHSAAKVQEPSSTNESKTGNVD